jgi:hypothetical protein
VGAKAPNFELPYVLVGYNNCTFEVYKLLSWRAFLNFFFFFFRLLLQAGLNHSNDRLNDRSGDPFIKYVIFIHSMFTCLISLGPFHAVKQPLTVRAHL